MEEAITWNRFLERDDCRLMWARADGMPWKGICYRFDISRPTAHRRYAYALSVIAWRLNGRQVHNAVGGGSSSHGPDEALGRRVRQRFRGSPAGSQRRLGRSDWVRIKRISNPERGQGVAGPDQSRERIQAFSTAVAVYFSPNLST